MAGQTLLTICGTIITGTFVFVCGQIIQRIVIEPIQEQRKNVAKIAQALTIYRNVFVRIPSYDSNPESKQTIDVTSAEIRKLAADLRAGYSLIPKNDWFARLRLVPSRETVRSVGLQLIRWHTFQSNEATHRAVQKIATMLKVDFIATEDEEFKDVMIEAAQD